MADTCLLCDPPEAVDAILDHLRVIHPDASSSLTSAGDLSVPLGPDPDPAAPFTRPVMTAADLEPHGARCCECSRLFKVGDPYCTVPEGAAGGIPVVSIVCVACGEPGR